MIATDRLLIRQLLAAPALLLLAAVALAQPADGPLVADVITTGNRITPRDAIIGQLKTRQGSVYSEANARDDVQKLKESRSFADVRVRLEPTADKRVVVVFELAEYPSLVREVVYKGPKHLKQSELDGLTGLKRGMPLNPIANQMACRAVEAKLRDDGKQFAHVYLEEGDKVGDTRVVFNITEGPEIRVRSIDFVGHGAWVSAARLRTQIDSSRSFLGFGGTYDPRKLDSDVMKLRDYYKTLGYLDAQITPEVIFTRDHAGVDVVYHVREGERFKVTKIEVVKLVDNKPVPGGELLKMVALKEGTTYDHNVVTADENAIQDKYGYEGKRVAVHASYVQTGPGEVAVQYQVAEQGAARINRIIIVGNDHTKDSVILRVLGLYEGQILSWPQVKAAEARLANLGLFETNPEKGVRPSVSVQDTEDPRYKDVIVNLQETTTGSFMLGIGVNSDSGLTGQIVLNERNFDIFRFPRSLDDLLSGNAFRGGGQEFRLEAMPGTQFQRYTASWREPALLDTAFGLAVSGYYYSRGFIEYNEERLGTRASLSRQLNRFWNVSETVRVEGVNVYQPSPFATPAITNNLGWSTLVGFRTGLTRDSRNSYLRPTSGSLFDASFEQVTGTYTYPLGNVEFSKYWTTWERRDGSGKHVFSYRTQLELAGDNTPVYERFYGGGFHSLRGFTYRGVGPFENNLNVGGQMAFLNTAEYQIPVLASDKFFLVGFVDHGTVERKFDITNYRVSAGVGLRIITPLTGPVPLALDFGFPIRKGPFDQKQIFAFYVGFGG